MSKRYDLTEAGGAGASACLPRTSGFTLLEVLVATAIMAFAVAGLLTTLHTSLNNATRVSNVDRAALLARTKMDELIAAPHLPKNTIIEGGWAPALTGGMVSGWRAQVTDFDKPPGDPVGNWILERINLEVWWDTAGHRQTFFLDGYRVAKVHPPGEPE